MKQSRVVNAQVKLMAIVVSVSLVQDLLVVCHIIFIWTFCPSNSDIADICVDSKLCMEIAKDSCGV
jgi:hypothetical protein